MWNWIKNLVNRLTQSSEDIYLSNATDAADFERRLKVVENPRGNPHLTWIYLGR